MATRPFSHLDPPRLDTPTLLSVARGDIPADLLLRNTRIVNVFSGEIEEADIAIAGGRIAGIGSGYDARVIVDLNGAYVAPGLIDAHVHIESSLCLPAQFAAAIVPRGVTTVLADPHEIANVAGAAGVRFMADASGGLPLTVILMAPSCVPATELATAGAKLTAADLQQLLNDGVVHGLAEAMNFPGVVQGDTDVLRKIATFGRRPVDGHAPGVSGKPLNAYVAAGVGSDHECVTIEEAKEKLARGMYVLVREATNARNLDALLPLINERNGRRICFCTDDRTPPDLLEQGSIDYMLRRAIDRGVHPITAFRCSTLNTAEWFQLHDRGAIAPGRVADLMIFDDLRAPSARTVYSGGRVVAQDGQMLPGVLPRHTPVPEQLTRTVNIKWSEVDFLIRARPGRVRVIDAQPDQLITGSSTVEPLDSDGQAVADVPRDVLKIAVIERHANSGRMGLGFIRGFGLKHGAIAGTVAHDHHNLVVIGADDQSMMAAATAVRTMNGGFAVAQGGRCLTGLSLPVAGLMTEDEMFFVAIEYRAMLTHARNLGCTLHDPFMAMSFMALEVIPSLKLTDRGLVDVDAMELVDLFV
jgi:adenine deaminase